jgi:glutamine amidotransferase
MKSKSVTVIDYGMGNISSIQNAFKYLGIKSSVSADPEKISRSNIIILPGVGSFKKAVENIKLLNIDEAIKNSKKKGNFILGICLGMQLLCLSSTEDGYTKGLGIVKLKLDKFSRIEVKNKKIPHVGFNKVFFDKGNEFYNGINNNSDFYFVHSYRVKFDKISKNFSTTNYGVNFLSSFNLENVYGTQFHPEKSQSNGLKLLNNFVKLT